MGRKLYGLLGKIPKEIKEYAYSLIDLTCKVAIYTIGIIGTTIAISYMFKGCQNQEKHVQSSELEKSLQNN